MSKPQMIDSLKPFWKTPSRYKVLFGGRGSGKSYGAAQHLIYLTSKYKLKVLAIRQYQNNIRESVYTLLKNVIYEFELQDEFEILSNTIRHKHTGSEFIFYGIARNFMEIKSTEGVDICYMEESHALTQEQFSVIDPTIRKEHSEVWLLFNPQNRSDFVWQNFVEHKRKNSIVKKINYDENIFLSRTMLSIIDEAKEEDYGEYEHIYLGKPREGDERSLFAYNDIESATDGNFNDVDSDGIFSYGVDVGRFGQDKSVITKRKGMRIYWLKEYAKYSTMELATTISREISEETTEPDAVFIDTIGVGGGVYDRLRDLGVRTIESNVSMKADEPDIYHNKRAEAYFGLREFIRKGGKIPNDRDLVEELLAIRYEFTVNGRIKITAKDKIKEVIGRSPDKSDSLMLHFFSKARPKALVNPLLNQSGGGGWLSN